MTTTTKEFKTYRGEPEPTVMYINDEDRKLLNWMANRDMTESVNSGRIIWYIEHDPLPVVMIEYYEGSWFVGMYCDKAIKYNGVMKDGFVAIEEDTMFDTVANGVMLLWEAHMAKAMRTFEEFSELTSRMNFVHKMIKGV